MKNILFLLLFISSFAFGQKISDLPAATAIGGTELLPVVQAGQTRKATIDQVKTYISVIDWSAITGTPTTVAGYGITDAVPTSRTINSQPLSANITLTPSNIGLSNVDNTSDANKPVSTAQATAIAVVQSDVNAHEALTNNPHSVTKSQVGLSDADNTSDADKPVSSAQQTAIDAKVADAINNGTTTIAPSQNAVFDALALKADAAKVWTVLTPFTTTGWSSFTIQDVKYIIDGKLVTIRGNIHGTGDGSILVPTLTLPFTFVANQIQPIWITNNVTAAVGRASWAAGATSITFHATIGGGNFTASVARNINFMIQAEIQ